MPTRTNPEHAEAEARRWVLVTYGCSTYVIRPTTEGTGYIVCLCCGRLSYNANDVVEKYCSFCHHFHNDWVVHPIHSDGPHGRASQESTP